MKVRILFFARLRDLLGTDSVELDSPDIESVGDAYRILLGRYPELGAFSRSLLVAVNQEFADWNTPVLEGDELALFPPVSGGQPPPDANYPTDGAGDIYQIVREKIRTRGLVSQAHSRPGWGNRHLFRDCPQQHPRAQDHSPELRGL